MQKSWVVKCNHNEPTWNEYQNQKGPLWRAALNTKPHSKTTESWMLVYTCNPSILQADEGDWHKFEASLMHIVTRCLKKDRHWAHTELLMMSFFLWWHCSPILSLFCVHRRTEQSTLRVMGGQLQEGEVRTRACAEWVWSQGFFFFEMVFLHYIAQAGLELSSFCLTLKCWDYVCAHQAQKIHSSL